MSDRTAPLYTPITTASNFGGMLGAFAVVAALIARERTGRGQRVELPLVEAMAEAYSTMLGHHVYDDTSMADNQMLRNLTHRCQDGGLIDCSPYPKFVISMLRGAGVAEDWERQGLIDLDANTFHLDRRDEIQDVFAALVAQPSRAVLGGHRDRAASSRSRWCGRDRSGSRRTPAREAGAVACVDDPVAGPTVMPGAGFDLSQRPTRTDRAPSRRRRPRRRARGTPLGRRPRHARDRDTPAATDEIERPLDGFRVIDITQAVAGPTAARLLADFGADVVKVGNPVPGVTDGIIGHLHRGKRTMLLDTTAPEGREILGPARRARRRAGDQLHRRLRREVPPRRRAPPGDEPRPRVLQHHRLRVERAVVGPARPTRTRPTRRPA